MVAQATLSARAKWGLRADDHISELADLAVYLGGQADTLTGQLLAILQEAGPETRFALRSAFPRQCRLYELWRECESPPTFAQLQLIEDIMCS